TSTMRIKFDVIETERGLETLHATLAPLQQNPGFELTSYTGPGAGYDVAIGPLPPNPALESGSTAPSPPSVASTPSQPPARPREPAEIALEVDSLMELLLTAPLGVKP